MQKLLTLLFVCLSGAAFSQSYSFDLLTIYKTKVNGKTDNRVIYTNTKDPHVFLTVGGFSGSSTAYLFDSSTGTYHKFKVKKSKRNDASPYTFKFHSTLKAEYPKSHYEQDFLFQELESDSIFKKVRITVYSDSSRKEPITYQVLTMKKSSQNLFPLYRVACLHPFETLLQMNFPGNYTVVSGYGETKGGFKIVTELTESGTAQLALVVPE